MHENVAPPASFLDTLGAVGLHSTAAELAQANDGSRNISDDGWQQRRDGALALTMLSALLTM
jgi:hypothetical protein